MTRDRTIDALISETDRALTRYRTDHAGLSWRRKVLLLVQVAAPVKQLGIHSDPRAATVGARERVRLYLTEHVGVVLAGAELEVVSGISECGRRVRELRVEQGYKILTGHSNDPDCGIILKPSEYLLLDHAPDVTAARRWHVANRIRKEKEGGSQGRLLRYLKENVGQVVTNEELYYVARAKEFGRRTRELRTEHGYAVATRLTGRPDLKTGEYVLESIERVAETHDRHIPFELQKEVYKRDHNACRLCGWNRDRWSRRDPRILELHHIHAHARGGPNSADNLVVLCSRCHDDLHAGRNELPPNVVE